ncbi:hypothetical protein TSOC111612_00895 [Tsukamurella ocularis]|uniref:hypothetical protein n=1 Tax=Tsukamurella ocularis TaxID=1970234 RepID=UPI0039F0E7FB
MPTPTLESPIVEELSDEERYNRAYVAADNLMRDSRYDPIENPAQLAEAIATADPRIGYNHALTVVLSLDDN